MDNPSDFPTRNSSRSEDEDQDQMFMRMISKKFKDMKDKKQEIKDIQQRQLNPDIFTDTENKNLPDIDLNRISDNRDQAKQEGFKEQSNDDLGPKN